MKQSRLTKAQREALALLRRRDISAIRKNPQIVAASIYLLRACRKVIRLVEDIQPHSNPKKRKTAYKRIVRTCEKAIARVGV